jgi:hypothetical protein
VFVDLDVVIDPLHLVDFFAWAQLRRRRRRPRTWTAPATLAINEKQAAVVRSIFEMFASGNFGLVMISRHLEERRI